MNESLKSAFARHDIVWPSELEFKSLVKALMDWRQDDHADAITLTRHQVILLLEGIRRRIDNFPRK